MDATDKGSIYIYSFFSKTNFIGMARNSSAIFKYFRATLMCSYKNEMPFRLSKGHIIFKLLQRSCNQSTKSMPFIQISDKNYQE